MFSNETTAFLLRCLRKTVWMLLVLWGITLVSFIVIHLAPGTPTDMQTTLNPLAGEAARAEVAVPMAVTVNASANTRLQIVFFFMVCYAPFLKYLWLCINLVCSIPEAALKFSRESAGKVSQIRHSACVIQ